jgi:peroxiredoxin
MSTGSQLTSSSTCSLDAQSIDELKGGEEDPMKRNLRARICIIAMLLAFVTPEMLGAQRPNIRQAARIGFPMPDFELPSYQGDTVSLSQFRGKNILLLFPRGRYENQWCRFCHYQYIELTELDRSRQIREELNLEVIQVMPYTKAELDDWVNDFQRNLGEIEAWKYPPNEDELSPGRRAWMETARETWPNTYDTGSGDVHLPFPILIDADRKVSIGLELFRTEWNVSRVEQNVPTIFIIDGNGVVRFKYVSQSTMDRPSFDYIIEFIERMILSEEG